MGDTNYAEIQEKLDRGETLTDQEVQDIMSAPPTEIGQTLGDEEINAIFEEGGAIDIDAENNDSKGDADKEVPKEQEKVPEEEPKKEIEGNDKIGEETTIDEDKVHIELEKPEGTEDFSKFTKAEKGLFWELRRERRARQKAEEERDALRFSELKRKAAEEEKKTAEENEISFDKEDDDFMTYGEFKKMQEKLAKQNKQKQPEVPQQSPYQQAFLAMCDKEARGMFDDYAEVMELADDLLGNNEFYQKEIATALQSGQNPAVKMYHLIKGDPAFPRLVPIAKARLQAKGIQPKDKPKETPDEKAKIAEENQKKMEENSKKAKTSGHHKASAESPDEGISLMQLMNMSDHEFSKIPKEKREAILKKYGA